MRKFFVVLMVAIVLAVAWIVIDKRSESDEQSKATPQASLTPGADARFSKRARQLEVALVSRSAVKARSVWVGKNNPPVAPKGATIKVDDRTFVSRKGAGCVNAVVQWPGQRPIEARLLLLFSGGKWLVDTMEKVK